MVYTDHKPLTYVLASSVDRSPRQTNHLSFIAEFTGDIRHVKGAENIVADTLSRPDVAAVQVPLLDFAALAAAQSVSDAEDSSLRIAKVLWHGTELHCDVSSGSPRPLVPVDFHRPVFEELHSLSHPGAHPTTRLAASRYVWPGLLKDVREWCRQCHRCQSSKISRHVRAPVTVLPPAVRRFGSVHLDIVGPLPPSEDHRYLLTMVDHYSRWPEAFPLKEILAASCAAAFVCHWLPRYGVPDTVVTDRGAQFTCSFWKTLLEQLGIASISTTAYHPQANGLVERMHRTLKAALKARLNNAAWMDELPLVLLGMRSAWKEGPDSTPAELLYGESLRLPGHLVPGVAPNNPVAG